MLINAIPVIGWLIAALVYTSIAVPFYFLWNALAPTYFGFLPSTYLSLPFLDCVGLFWLSGLIRGALYPKLSVVNNNGNKQ